MYCKKCNKEYVDHVKFCTICGSALTKKQDKEPKKWKPIYTVLIALTSVLVFCLALILCLVLIIGNGYTLSDKWEDFQETVFGVEEDYHRRDRDDDDEDDDDDYEDDEDEDEEDDRAEKENRKEMADVQQAPKDDPIPGYTGTTSDYVLPDSSSRYLTMVDLAGLTADECRIARNEIYARHGRMFKDEGLQAYFNSFSWYVPTIPADAFQESMLNAYEIANRDLIVQYETLQGYR